MKKRWEISRRAFLGGAGVSIALPYLEAMVPSVHRAKAAGDSPCRLAFIHIPNGMVRTNFTPTTEGADYATPPLFRNLEDLRNDFLILSGLSQDPGRHVYEFTGVAAERAGRPEGFELHHGADDDHTRDVASFLTAWSLPDGNNVSVDQVAADYLRPFTPIVPSLVMGAWDNGPRNSISWIGPERPASRLLSPKAIFDLLFSGFDPGATEAERQQRTERKQSILDAVREHEARLRPRLGRSDHRKLDEYLDGIRQLEVRINSSASLQCDPGTAPPLQSESRPEHNEHIFELIRLAFQCDRTRVVTYTMDWKPPLTFLGWGGDFHEYSHLNNAESLVAMDTIHEWQLGQLASLLRRLRDTVQGDGSNLLDDSLILFGAGLDATSHGDVLDKYAPTLGDLTSVLGGETHRHNNLPLILAGHGGGVRSGRHLVFPNHQTPIADLHISLLHAIGLETNAFGLEGTGRIEALF